jgi:hypothetical protein
MPDLTADLLPRLQAFRMPGLDLGEGFVYPNYSGYSLLNIPSTVCRLLGTPGLGAPPLADDILSACGGDYQRVILLVVDGLGFDQLSRYWQAGMGTIWKSFLPGAVLAPITSICPSTTSAALTTLWTGASPAEHGIAGYELWLREYGVVANMILHAPMSFANDNGGLKRAGFVPEDFLPGPTLGGHLLRHGIESYAFMHQAISRSGLSAMHLRQVTTMPFRSPADMWVSLRQLLQSGVGKKRYVNVYWGDLDELSHRYGPDNERVYLEFESFSRAFESCFLSKLSPAERRSTLLILTADHGQLLTPHDRDYELRFHPRLEQALHMQPTGENRLAYFYIRPGKEDFVLRYLDSTWKGKFKALSARQALSVGLLGPGSIYGRLPDRLGDMLVISRGDAFLWWASKENPLLGRHGGLSRQEMLVPFIAVNLEN